MRRLSLLLLALGSCAGPGPRTAPARPNVVVVFTDDHGWADLGVQGVRSDLRTPHLDRLARDGARFTNGYVTAPQCVPSRAGLLTGRHQQRFGVEDNTKGPLPRSETTLADRLRAAGYATGMVGKWHLDQKQAPGGGRGTSLPEHLPGRHGFSEYFCGNLRRYHASHDLRGKPLPDAPAAVDDARFRIEVQTEAALSFVERHRSEPFFLYLSYFGPHTPIEATEAWMARFPDVADPKRRTALAMLAAIDDGVGRLRAKLAEAGLAERTLVFFVGDNGAPLRPDAWNGSLNEPLVGEKGMLTDGGTRVPFLAAWPGTIPAGTVYEPPVSALDVAATAVAGAGLAAEGLDGADLVPFLRGERRGVPHEHLFWRWRSQAAVRSGPWKLVFLAPDRQWLFDLSSPEGERRDRAAEHPERVRAMRARLEAWCAGLAPPGFPAELHPQDAKFFADHLGAR